MARVTRSTPGARCETSLPGIARAHLEGERYAPQVKTAAGMENMDAEAG